MKYDLVILHTHWNSLYCKIYNLNNFLKFILIWKCGGELSTPKWGSGVVEDEDNAEDIQQQAI